MGYDSEQIWNEFSAELSAFIAHRVSNPETAEDLLQDVFLKIHANIDSLKDDMKIRSWVYQIARNAIIDHYRKHKVSFEDIDEFEIADKNDVIDGMIENGPAQEVADGLKAMIEDLPEIYSQALYLVEFDGLSQVELAHKLGISVAGAKSRVQRGRLMLRDRLMRCCHFELDRFGAIINIHPICCCCCNGEEC